MTSVPATVAHAVRTSGECRRITGPAKAVYVAQHSAAASVSTLPIREPVISIPTPAAITTTTPRNDSTAPANFCGVSVSAPATTARTAVKTGVAAMSSAESPAGIDWSPTVQSIWYAPNPSAPRSRIRPTSGRGRRIGPSVQRRMARSAREASP
jgi:hypothetical protein